MKGFLKKYLAYIVAAVVFFVLAYTYCFPVLQGRVLYAGDNVNAEAAVHECEQYTERTGDHSWWTGSMFGGMPNYQIGGGQYKGEQLLSPFASILHRGHAHTAWVFIIYFFCFFVLLRSFDVDKWLSIIGAIAITLSSYFIVIIAAGHNGKTSTIALMSVVLAGMYLIFHRKYILGAILAAIFTAVGFTAHPQMAYYLFMMMGLIWVAELIDHIRTKRYKEMAVASLIFFGSVGLGFGACCSNVFVNSEYASQTMRGGHSDLVKEGEEVSSAEQSKGLDIQYATQWSYGIDESLSFIIPGIKGGASSVKVGKDSHIYKALKEHGMSNKNASDFCQGIPMYWGEQPFTAGNVYMGAIVCFLFVLGIFIVKGPYKWALLLSTVFSILLAWGSNFMGLTEVFFKYFPLYNKFRTVSSILIVAEVAMPLLGFMAVSELIKGSVDKLKARKSLYISAGVTAGVCALVALFGGMFASGTSSYDAQWAGQLPGWLYDSIIDDRISLMRRDALRSMLLILGSGGILWLFVERKLKSGWMIAALGALILVDMWPVDKRYLNDDNFVSARQSSSAFAMQPYEQALLQDPDPHFRVMNLTTNTFNDARTSYYLKSIGGYHAAKLRRYQDLIDEHLSKLHLPVIGMLNAKYLITQDEDGSVVPQLNPYALDNAWYVGSLTVVDSANAESDALMQIDLSHEAVLDRSFEQYVTDFEPGIAEDASVELTSYSPKQIDYRSSSSQDGTIVFSEIYYPYGWHASIDGQAVEHYRVNYMLRALNVPAGQHEISFVFDPESVRRGDAIAVVCISLIYLLIAGALVYAVIRWKKRKAEK